jgi:DNA-binding NarL/FixJ family response regulator
VGLKARYNANRSIRMEPTLIQVAIVEDDDEIRANLGYRIGDSSIFRLKGAYSDAESALENLPKNPPDVVLMDINLPGMDGVECVRQLKPQMPRTQFIMLTVYEDSKRLFKSLMAGASGYLLKRTTPSKLLAAIREAHQGGSPMTPQIARLVVQHFQHGAEPSSDLNLLTAREREVLDQLSKGFRYKEIVSNLVISDGTLHSHIRNIYDKLHVHSRTEAVVKYLNSAAE